MTRYVRNARSKRRTDRRTFLASTAVAASTVAGLSHGSRTAVATDSSDANGVSKPISTRIDSAASYGTGGYKLYNSGQLTYHSSFPSLDRNGDVKAWIHRFSITGFGYTVTHINGPNDEPYFGNHLIRGGNQRIGQYIGIETDDAVGLSLDHGAKSGGWLHPTAIWESFKDAVDSSSYTVSEVAEEFYDSPDTGMAEQFFDSDVESLEGEIEHYVETHEEVDGDRYEMEDFILGALLAYGGIVISMLPHGAAVNYGLTAGELAYSAYDGITGDPDEVRSVENSVRVQNAFDNSVAFPEHPEYITIDDEGVDIFEGQGTPMRGHHVAIDFETPLGDAFDSWDVEIEQGFDVIAYNTDGHDSSTFKWKIELPTGSEYSFQRTVQARGRNAMANVKADPPGGQHEYDLLYH